MAMSTSSRGTGFAGGAGIARGGNSGGRDDGSASDGFGTSGAIVMRPLVAGTCAAQNALAVNMPNANTIAAVARIVRRNRASTAGSGSLKDTKETTAGTRRQPQLSAGTLYVLATPLGHLDDLTIRARSTLALANRILVEDTRVTATLLSHCGITTRPTALHAHNEAKRVQEVLAALDRGEQIALVSDAGTPAISDPGARLVRAVHEAGHRVVPVPGPSAVTAAVSVSGLLAERFVFVGFLPTQAKHKQALLSTLQSLPAALVIFEAPHRIRETVALLAASLPGERMLVIARELTKKFEQIARMPLSQGGAWLAEDANRVRGEFVLVIDAPLPSHEDAELTPEVERWLLALLAELPPSAAAPAVAPVRGAARDVVYARATRIKGDPDR